MHSFQKRAFWQILNSIINIAYPLFTFPYITRLLGPHNLGIVNYLDSFIQFIVFIAALGIPIYGIKEIAANTDNKEEQSRLLYQLIIINFLFTLLFIGGFLTYNELIITNDFPSELVFLGVLNLFASPFIADWYFQANEQYGFLLFRNMAIKTILISFIFCFVNDSNDYILYYFLFTAVNIIAAISNIIIYSRQAVFKFSYFTKIKTHLNPLLVLFTTMGCISFYVYLDTIILGYFKSYQEVGIYSAGVKIIRIVLYFILTTLSLLLPIISSFAKTLNKHEINNITTQAIKIITFIGLPLSTGLYIMAEPIVLLIAGKDFIDASIVIKITSPLPIIIGLSNLFGINLLVPLGKSRMLLIAVFISCLIGIPMQILMTNLFSYIGTAISTLLIESFVFFICYFFLRKYISLSIGKRFWKPLTYMTIASLVLFSYINSLNTEPIMKVSFFFFAFCALVGVGLFLFKGFFNLNVFNPSLRLASPDKQNL